MPQSYLNKTEHKQISTMTVESVAPSYDRHELIEERVTYMVLKVIYFISSSQ